MYSIKEGIDLVGLAINAGLYSHLAAITLYFKHLTAPETIETVLLAVPQAAQSNNVRRASGLLL